MSVLAVALITPPTHGRYDQQQAHWKEVGGISEQEGLELMDNARQAVEAFSTFMEEFSEKAGFDYCPPKGGNSRNQTA